MRQATEAERELPRAGLLRRLAALLYDIFLVAAIWMLLGLILQLIVGTDNNQIIDGQVITDPMVNNLLFFLMLTSSFSFYCWFWMRSGQTLGMLAWRLRADSMDGGRLKMPQAIIRFFIAWPAFLLLGAGFLWLYLDKQGDTIHDKVSRSKIVIVPKSYRPF